jgi:hypothetical protein
MPRCREEDFATKPRRPDDWADNAMKRHHQNVLKQTNDLNNNVKHGRATWLSRCNAPASCSSSTPIVVMWFSMKRETLMVLALCV